MKLLLHVAAWVAIIAFLPKEGSTGLVPVREEDADVDNYQFLSAEDEHEDVEKRFLLDILFPTTKKGDTGGLLGGIIGILTGLGNLFNAFTNALAGLVVGITNPLQLITADFQLDINAFLGVLFGSSVSIKVDVNNATDVLVKVVLPLTLSLCRVTIAQNGTLLIAIPTSFNTNGDVFTSVQLSVAAILSNSNLAAAYAAKFLDVNAKLGLVAGTCNKNCTSRQVLIQFLLLLNVEVKGTLPALAAGISDADLIQYVVNVFSKGGTNLIKLFINGTKNKSPLGVAVIALIKWLNLSLTTGGSATLDLSVIITALINGNFSAALGQFVNANGLIDFVNLINALPANLGAALQVLLKPLSLVSAGTSGFDAVAFLSVQSGGKSIAAILNITNVNAFQGLDLVAFLQLLIKGGPGIGLNVQAMLSSSGAPDVVKLMADSQAYIGGGAVVTVNTLLKDLGCRLDVGGVSMPDYDLKQVVDISAFLSLVGKGCGLSVELPAVLAKLDSSKADLQALLVAIKGLLSGNVSVSLDAFFKACGVDNIGAILNLPSPASSIDLTAIVQIFLKGLGINLSSVVNLITCQVVQPVVTTIADIVSQNGGGINLTAILAGLDFTSIDFVKLWVNLQGILTGNLQLSLQAISKLVGIPDIPDLAKLPSFTQVLDAKTFLYILSGGVNVSLPDVVAKINSVFPNFIKLWVDLKLFLSGDVTVTLSTLCKDSGLLNVGEVFPTSKLDTYLTVLVQALVKASSLDLSVVNQLVCDKPNYSKFVLDLTALINGSVDVNLQVLLIDLGLTNIAGLLQLPGCKAVNTLNIQVLLQILEKSIGLSVTDILVAIKSLAVPDLDISAVLQLISQGQVGGIDISTILAKLNCTEVLDISKLQVLIQALINGNVTITIKDVVTILGFPNLLTVLKLPAGSETKVLNLTTILEIVSGGSIDFGLIIPKIISILPNPTTFWQQINDILTGKVLITISAMWKLSGLSNLDQLIQLPPSIANVTLNVNTILGVIAKVSALDLSILTNLNCNAPDFIKVLVHLEALLNGSVDITSGTLLTDSGCTQVDVLLQLPISQLINNLNINVVLIGLTKASGLTVTTVISCIDSIVNNPGITTTSKPGSSTTTKSPDTTTTKYPDTTTSKYPDTTTTKYPTTTSKYPDTTTTKYPDTTTTKYPDTTTTKYPDTTTSKYPDTTTTKYPDTTTSKYPDTTTTKYPTTTSKYPDTTTSKYPDTTTTKYPDTTTTKYPDTTTTKYPDTTTTKYPDTTTTKYPDTTTSKYPDTTTTKYPTTTSKYPDTTTSKYPDTTTSKYPDTTTSKYPDTTTSKYPDTTTTKYPTTTSKYPDTTTSKYPDTTTSKYPDTTTTKYPTTTSKYPDTTTTKYPTSATTSPNSVTTKKPTIPVITIEGILILCSGGTVGGWTIIDIISNVQSGSLDISGVIQIIIKILTGITITIQDVLTPSGLIALLPNFNFPSGVGGSFNLTTVLQVISNNNVTVTDILNKWQSTLPSANNFWTFIISVITGKIDVTIKGLCENSGILNIGDIIVIPGVDSNSKIQISNLIQIILTKLGLDISILNILTCKAPDFTKLILDIILQLNGTGSTDVTVLFGDCGLPDITIFLQLFPGCGSIKTLDVKSLLPILSSTSGLTVDVVISKLKSLLAPTTGTTTIGTTTTGNPLITTPTGTPGPVLPTITIQGLFILCSGGKVNGWGLTDIISTVKSTAPNVSLIIKVLIDLLNGLTININDCLTPSGLVALYPILSFPGSAAGNFNLSTAAEIVSGGQFDLVNILNKLDSNLPDLHFWELIVSVLTGSANVTLTALCNASGFPNIGSVIILPGVDSNANIQISAIVQAILIKLGLDVSILNTIKCQFPNVTTVIEELIILIKGTGNVNITTLLTASGFPTISVFLQLFPGSAPISNIDTTSILTIVTKTSGLDIDFVVDKLQSCLPGSTTTGKTPTTGQTVTTTRPGDCDTRCPCPLQTTTACPVLTTTRCPVVTCPVVTPTPCPTTTSVTPSTTTIITHCQIACACSPFGGYVLTANKAFCVGNCPNNPC